MGRRYLLGPKRYFFFVDLACWPTVEFVVGTKTLYANMRVWFSLSVLVSILIFFHSN